MKPYHKATTSRNLKNTSITNNGVETTTSNKTKVGKILESIQLKQKHNTISTNNNQGAKLKINKCERMHSQ
jgi:hypothetical protein